MARLLRVPGIVDLIQVDDPATIWELANDDRLDRRFEARGPLVNLALTHRIRTLLEVDGRHLPSVAPRGDPQRVARQAELEAELTGAGEHRWSERQVEDLAAFVRGQGQEAALGPLVQEVVGRLFVPDYEATPESYAAAKLFDAAPRTRNPLKLAFWQLTGRLYKARRLLAKLARGDLACVHATGIAMHNLVRAFELMRELFATPGAPAQLSTEAVLGRCLVAPPSVMRQALALGSSTVGELRPGTLVMLQLDDARLRAPDQRMIFMTGSWAQCPAHAWVPALLRAVWERATQRSSGETHR